MSSLYASCWAGKMLQYGKTHHEKHCVTIFLWQRNFEVGTVSRPSWKDYNAACFKNTSIMESKHHRQLVPRLNFFVFSLQRKNDNVMKSSKNGVTTLSRINFSRHVGHATIFSWMLNTACCLVVRLALGLDCVWMVCGYAHVFILLSVVTVTLPITAGLVSK